MIPKSKNSEWKISWNKYKELCYFCLQYDEKKREAENLLTLRISTPQPEILSDGSGAFMPHGSGGVSDPVSIMAEKRERLLADCRMIEQAAVCAGGDLAPYLLKSVTKRGGVRAVIAEMPTSERTFYRIRRMFFYILSNMKFENS